MFKYCWNVRQLLSRHHLVALHNTTTRDLWLKWVCLFGDSEGRACHFWSIRSIHSSFFIKVSRPSYRQNRQVGTHSWHLWLVLSSLLSLSHSVSSEYHYNAFHLLNDILLSDKHCRTVPIVTVCEGWIQLFYFDINASYGTWTVRQFLSLGGAALE